MAFWMQRNFKSQIMAIVLCSQIIMTSCRIDRDEDDIEDVYNILESYALQVYRLIETTAYIVTYAQ